MNGLDNLDPNSLVFNGKFFSANIFHPITEKLRVMYHDLSLGFETETRGNDPNPVYLNRKEEGEGKFIGTIGISNEGFIGNGRLDFLGAAIESEYVEFRPYQFIAENVDTFELEKETINGYDFPMVKGQNVQIDWIPYSDSMAIMSSDLDKAKFNFFSDSIDFGLNGILALTPFGVKGKGIFDWYGATLESNTTGDFKFQKNGLSSSSSSVVIKSKLGDGSAFKNNNVEFVIDFDKQTGDFKALKDDLSTDLPHNSYQTTLSEFHWDMKKNNIQMDAGEDGSGFFLAMNNSQDSLIFSGTSANYNIDSGTLVIDGVDSVKIADAFIYPNNDRIVIEQGSKMKTLKMP